MACIKHGGGGAISFILVLLTGEGLPDVLYFFLGNAFIPLFITSWMLGVSILLGKKKIWLLPAIYLIISISMDIYLFYFLIVEPTQIGVVNGYWDAQYNIVWRLYLIFVLASILVTGLQFAIESFKSEKPEVNLKGKFIIVGFLSYFFGGLIDSGTSSPFLLVLARTILIIGALCVYNGFLLPERVKKIFIKN